MISMETLKKTIQISSLAKAKDLARAEAATASRSRTELPMKPRQMLQRHPLHHQAILCHRRRRLDR